MWCDSVRWGGVWGGVIVRWGGVRHGVIVRGGVGCGVV